MVVVVTLPGGGEGGEFKGGLAREAFTVFLLVIYRVF